VGKRQDYARAVTELLDDPPALGRLLLARSGLPGPRGNLELAAALADAVAVRGPAGAPWGQLFEWFALGPAEAPNHQPAVFLSFCALQALAALYLDAEPEAGARIVAALDRAAEDDRWRVREAAAMGLQRIGERDLPSFLALAERWAEAPSERWQRAALVALAHPPLLGEAAVVERALGLTDGVLRGVELRARPARVAQPDTDWADDEARPARPAARGRRGAKAGALAPRSEDERVLLLALQFAPSVLVAAAPGPGFAMLRRWASSRSPLVQRIVVANLRKSRLARRFSSEIEEIGEVLAASVE
jgi:hypothetical protein